MPAWKQINPTVSPPARKLHAIVYDESRQKTVLFGGYDAGGRRNDLWEYNGSAWEQINTASRPSARYRSPMIYAAHLQSIFLFGGSDNDGHKNDLWEFNGTNWSEKTGILNPPAARSRHAMVYDSHRQTILLFGGFDGSRLNDTWEFDFSTNAWTNLAPSNPPSARYDPGMVYDSQRHKTVLFGGYDGSRLNDTWEYDRSTNTWSLLSPAISPPARSDHAMIYDPDRQKIVVMGGYNGSTQLSDTWEFDGTGWSENTAASPSLRTEHAMTYDAQRRKVVLFGGYKTSEYYDDTWEYGLPPAEVWVDDNWASGVAPGEDPDASGPATAFGTDAFATVQSAIAGVASGGTVHIAAGTYLEQIRLSKTVTLTSLTGDHTTGGVILNPNGAEYEGPQAGADQVRAAVTLETGSDHTILKGITIENNYADALNGNAGIEAIDGGIEQVTIDGVRINNVAGHAVGVYDSGYTWPPLSGWIIRNCSFSVTGANTIAIHAQNMEELTIQDCEIGPADENGIRLSNTNIAEIQNCRIHDLGKTGIEIDSYCTGEILIANNELWAANTASLANHGDVVFGGQFLPDPHGDDPAAITIRDNRFRDGWIGVCIKSGEDISTRSILLQTNLFSNHTNAAVSHVGSGTLNAEENWWGNESGPLHATLNPQGKGETVIGDVDFTPWLANVPGNRPPTAIDDSTIILEDGGTVAIDVLANDSDPDGDALTIASIVQGNHGTASRIENNKRIAYTPNANVYGEDTITYTITDARGGTDTAAIAITILSQPDAPTAENVSVSTAEDYPVFVLLRGHDVDGDAIVYSIVSHPLHGALSGFDPVGGRVTYNPASNYFGSDTFTYRCHDGQLDSSDATVTVHIREINDPPIAYSQTISTSENTSVKILLRGDDVDGNSISYHIVSPPAQGALSEFNSSNGSLVYTPNPGFYGLDSFQFITNDGVRLANQVAAVVIHVIQVSFPTQIPTPTPTNSPHPTATPSPYVTPTHTPTLTCSPTQTYTPSPSCTPTCTFTNTPTPSPTPTPTLSPSPTHTPRAGNHFPEIAIHPQTPLFYRLNEQGLISIIASDKDKDPLQISFSSDAKLRKLCDCYLPGNAFVDLVLETSQLGDYFFEVNVYDGSDRTRLKVLYSIVETNSTIPPPSPTRQETGTIKPTATPRATPSGVLIVTDSIETFDDLSNLSDTDSAEVRELGIRWYGDPILTDFALPYEIHVYAREDAGDCFYLGRMPENADPCFQWLNPEFGHTYEFAAYLILLQNRPDVYGPYFNAGPVTFLEQTTSMNIPPTATPLYR